MFTSKLAVTVGLLIHALNVGARDETFFNNTLKPLVTARLSPVLNPGIVSLRLFTAVGGSAFGPTYDYNTSLAAECTTSQYSDDKSNYYVSSLYHHYEDGTLRLSELKSAEVRYFFYSENDEEIHEFPPGFMMTTGNIDKLDESTSEQIVFTCPNDSNDVGIQRDLPLGNCPGGLQPQITFPSCWDGKNTYLTNNAHMSYSIDGISRGPCPDSHKFRLPRLTYKFLFSDDIPYNKDNHLLSNGDLHGFSFVGTYYPPAQSTQAKSSGRFTNGWPAGTLKQVIDAGGDCNDPQDTSCPELKRQPDGYTCEYKGITVNEDIGDKNTITKLPGNNPLWGDSDKVNPKPHPDKGYKETATLQTPSPAATTSAFPQNRLAPNLAPGMSGSISSSAQLVVGPSVFRLAAMLFKMVNSAFT